MFGFLRPARFHDPALGTFERSRGRWRGRLSLAGSPLPLAVVGTRRAPDPEALAMAARLPSVWSTHRDAVARALVEHLAPYREAVAAGEAEPPDRPFPGSDEPADVWPSVALLSASVTTRRGKHVSEVALAVTWDEEHTLGARFDRGAFIELNGSILPE